jgi:hypothetical protein
MSDVVESKCYFLLLLLIDLITAITQTVTSDVDGWHAGKLLPNRSLVEIYNPAL